MSCTTALKDELARFDPQKECCAAAELAAAARGMGELSLLGGGRFGLTLSTEHEPTALRMAALCRRLFGFAPDIALISKRQPRPKRIFSLFLDDAASLDRLGIGAFPTPLGGFIKDDCCIASALRGTFLACGVISDPEKQYLMEFSLSGETAAEEVVELLARSGISCSWTERGEKEIIYVKEFDSLVTLTGLMEGYSTLLKLENARVLKDVRNRINRRTNCDTANIGKTVNASVQQTDDILFLSRTCGLSSLSEPLAQAARLRLEHGDYSLAELAAAAGISRSAMNNRLRALRERAAQMRASGITEPPEL